MEQTNLKKALGPFKIMDYQEGSFLMLHRRFDWNIPCVIIIMLLFVLKAWKDALFVVPTFAITVISFLFLFLVAFFVWSMISKPKDINVQCGILTLHYWRIFAKNTEHSFRSEEIKGIYPEAHPAGRSGIYAVIHLHLSNGKRESLYFANRQFNKQLILEYAKLLACTFASILNVPVIDNNETKAP